MRCSFGSSGERFGFHCPSEWLGHGSVEVVDELFDLVAEVVLAGEIAAANEFSDEDREPDLDLVEPRGMSRCEVEGEALLGLGQEGGAGGLGGRSTLYGGNFGCGGPGHHAAPVGFVGPNDCRGDDSGGNCQHSHRAGRGGAGVSSKDD